MRYCYTCAHYTCQQATVVVRNPKGDKLGTKAVPTERCAARKMVEIMVPAVIGASQVRLLSRQQFEKLAVEARAEGRPEPFVYGSEAAYPGHECPLYSKKERTFYCDREDRRRAAGGSV